jgi:hypothetical protein
MPETEMNTMKKNQACQTNREGEEKLLEEMFDVDFKFDLNGYHSDATNLLLQLVQHQVLMKHFQKAMRRYENFKGPSENMMLFFENKRKLMKNVIKQKKEIMDKKLKTPPFLRLSDKLTFTIGVATIMFTQYLLLLYPQMMYLWYSLLFVPLISWRYYCYSQMKYQYFMLDFCYFAQAVLFVWLYIFPNTLLFQIVFAMCNGPLAIGIVMWRNSLVFHDLDKVTSVFIHIFPPLVTYCARWYPFNNNLSLVCSNPDCGTSLYEMMFLPMVFYCIWQVLYLLQTEIIDQEKLAKDKDIITTVRYWTYVKPHSLLFYLRSKGVTMDSLYILTIIQALYTLLCFVPVIPIYHSYHLHTLYLIGLFFACIWNGANFYFEIFTETYAKRLRRFLKDETKNAQSCTDTDQEEVSVNLVSSTQ